jgi:hypothetical protein
MIYIDIQNYDIKSYEADFQVCLNERELNIECGFDVDINENCASLEKLTMIFVDAETLEEITLQHAEVEAIKAKITPMLNDAIHDDSFNYCHDLEQWQFDKDYDNWLDR